LITECPSPDGRIALAITFSFFLKKVKDTADSRNELLIFNWTF
jgi:hypothetical protein